MDHTKKLSSTVNTTAECRFIAAARLEKRDLSMTQLTSFTSAYVIILTALPYFLKLPEIVEDHINLLTVALSIVVLVSSLSQYSRGDVVKAEQHHRCGLELKELHREIVASSSTSEAEFKKFSSRYSAIMAKYGSNHEIIDYKAYELNRKSELEWVTWWTVVRNSVELFIANEGPKAALAVSTITMLGVIFFYALPAQVSN